MTGRRGAGQRSLPDVRVSVPVDAVVAVEEAAAVARRGARPAARLLTAAAADAGPVFVGALVFSAVDGTASAAMVGVDGRSYAKMVPVSASHGSRCAVGSRQRTSPTVVSAAAGRRH